MATKTIVIGETNSSKNLKPIEFVYLLNSVTNPGSDRNLTLTDVIPSCYNYVELICKDYHGGYDLIFGYDDPISRRGWLYVGHWNDGVV